MKKGFLTGGLEAKGKREEPTRIATVRASLVEAELELRGRRQARLEFLSASSGKDGSKAAAPSLNGEAVKALASHKEPPPGCLYRLAQALSLVVNAPMLVSAGFSGPLPQTSWSNLQHLLRERQWGTVKEEMDEIHACLRQPFGQRVAQQIRRMLEEPPLKAEDVATADGRCLPLLDFLHSVLGVGDGASSQEVDGEREARLKELQEKVEAQEKEVAKLRKQLEEVQKSEAAAASFAAENRPPDPSASSSTALVTEGPPASKIVSSTHMLQYRLQEVAVPQLQESVLISVARAVMEPRAGEARSLRITGYSEEREEDEVASQRASSVQIWLQDIGVPEERLSVQSRSGCSRGSRKVEIELLDAAERDSGMRQRASEVMSRVLQFGDAAAPSAEVPAPAKKASLAPELQPQTAAVEPPAEEAPEVTVEELQDIGGGQQALRVIFRKAGLSPSDVSLEVATRAVRLASLSGAWRDLEVPLPCPVQPVGATAAKFSKKQGTLTVTLLPE